MTKAKRVALNVAATYGRSLVALVCGLFTSRWVLMALGESDFGVWSVVGGLTAFVSFVNSLFAAATSRFFAFHAERPEECRAWFSTAVLVHLVLATMLVVVGYPIGVWCVRTVLAIPSERLNDAVLIFRLVCCSTWVGMAGVPFQSMYAARQNIAEMSLYALAQTLLHFFFLAYAVSHPGDWLVPYVGVLVGGTVAVNVLMALGARRRYSCCRGWGRVTDFPRRLRELGVYAFWQLFGSLGYLARTQGVNVLLNRLVGTSANAAFGVSSQVKGQVESLSSALIGAFSPAIMTDFGSGDRVAAQTNSMRACRLSLLMMLVFALPLLLELHTVLALWLVHPPAGSEILCGAVLTAFLIDKSTSGHLILLNANGRLGGYQMTVGGVLMLSLPLAWGLYVCGLGLMGVGAALVLGSLAAGIGRVFFARRLVGLSARLWVRKVVLPVVLLSLITLGVGLLPRLILSPGFLRVVTTTIASLIAFLPLAWFLVLSEDERVAVQKAARLRKEVRPVSSSLPLRVYAARTREDALLSHSSSGGVFTELAREVLRHGGVPFATAVDCALRPWWRRAGTWMRRMKSKELW